MPSVVAKPELKLDHLFIVSRMAVVGSGKARGLAQDTEIFGILCRTEKMTLNPSQAETVLKNHFLTPLKAAGLINEQDGEFKPSEKGLKSIGGFETMP